VSPFVKFPFADTITRRIKKLCNIIVRYEEMEGEITFDLREKMVDDKVRWTRKFKR